MIRWENAFERKQTENQIEITSYLSLLLLLLIGYSHAHWRHVTTTTRILFVLSFMINFGNPSEVQTTKESKTLKDSGHA